MHRQLAPDEIDAGRRLDEEFGSDGSLLPTEAEIAEADEIEKRYAEAEAHCRKNAVEDAETTVEAVRQSCVRRKCRSLQTTNGGGCLKSERRNVVLEKMKRWRRENLNAVTCAGCPWSTVEEVKKARASVRMNSTEMSECTKYCSECSEKEWTVSKMSAYSRNIASE